MPGGSGGSGKLPKPCSSSSSSAILPTESIPNLYTIQYSVIESVKISVLRALHVAPALQRQEGSHGFRHLENITSTTIYLKVRDTCNDIVTGQFYLH